MSISAEIYYWIFDLKNIHDFLKFFYSICIYSLMTKHLFFRKNLELNSPISIISLKTLSFELICDINLAIFSI